MGNPQIWGRICPQIWGQIWGIPKFGDKFVPKSVPKKLGNIYGNKIKGLKNNFKALSRTLVIDANAHFKCAIFMRDLRLERAFSYLSLGQRADGALFKYLSVWHLAKEGLATLLAPPKIGQQS